MSDPDICEEAYFKAQGYSDEQIEAIKEMRQDWAKNKEEAENSVNRIIFASAERAKVLFDVFGFEWVTEETRNKKYDEHEHEVPSLNRIADSLREYVNTIRQSANSDFELGSTGGGRLYAWAEYDFESGLTDIKLLFELGDIPIQYLWENGPSVAKRMERENRRLRQKASEKK